MNHYTKPHLTYSDQILLLQSRNLEVPDRQKAESALKNVGYYRLSGYWYPYREALLDAERGDKFHQGATLNQVVSLYNFDRRLKLLILDAIEQIEVGMRVRVAYTLGKRSVHAHLKSGIFRNPLQK